MNSKKIIAEIKEKYPGKTIICDQKVNPNEIICEIDPSSKHPEKSIALVIVGKSKLHYHKISTEIYEAVKGELIVFINGKRNVLNEGEKITIKPGHIHSAEGKESWFLTHSRPGWRFDDHIVVK